MARPQSARSPTPRCCSRLRAGRCGAASWCPCPASTARWAPVEVGCSGVGCSRELAERFRACHACCACCATPRRVPARVLSALLGMPATPGPTRAEGRGAARRLRASRRLAAAALALLLLLAGRDLGRGGEVGAAGLQRARAPSALGVQLCLSGQGSAPACLADRPAGPDGSRSSRPSPPCPPLPGAAPPSGSPPAWPWACSACRTTPAAAPRRCSTSPPRRCSGCSTRPTTRVGWLLSVAGWCAGCQLGRSRAGPQPAGPQPAGPQRAFSCGCWARLVLGCAAPITPALCSFTLS